MRVKYIIFVIVLLLFGQLSCLKTVTQEDISGIRNQYENALGVVQGSVMVGDVSSDMSGEEIVRQGLAGSAYLLKEMSDYYLTAKIQEGGGKLRAVLLLCTKKNGYALLEGVLCKNTKFIEERWQETPKHPCDFSIQASERCQ